MSVRTGFWSYVHADDLAEHGRIKQLAADLADQYALIGGESVEIFVDRNDLVWGDNWREKIDASLESGLFFIPVITPRFLLSTECRRELQTFVRSAENLGVRELILPLVYADVPALSEELPEDEAVLLVQTFQWEDWRDLRFEDVTSSSYRRGVARLARRLVDAGQQVIAQEPKVPVAPDQAETPADGDEEELGTLDLLVIAEDAMPRLATTLNDLLPEIELVGQLAQKAAEDIQRSDQQGKGAAGRLAVSRKLAQDLASRANRILELANTYTTLLYDVDRGITTVIRQAPEEIKSDPSERGQWNTFSEVITSLAATTNESMEGIRGLTDNLEKAEAVSRDLRPPVRNLRKGLTILAEGTAVIDEWKRLTDEASIIIGSAQE
jgi:TIR domain